MNPQKLEEIATKNSQESKVISTTEALRKMIASGAVEYSEKYQKHVAEIYWFPYVLDNDMHTIIAGKQSQFYSKTEKRFICTGTGHQLSHQALIDDFFDIFYISGLRKRCLARSIKSCRPRRSFHIADR